MAEPNPQRQVKGYECRFAVSCPPARPGGDDLHVVKEVIHYTDGTTSTNLRKLMNYQRPFWIAKKGCRNYEDKKEWEDKSKLIEFKSTQSNLVTSVARAMDEMYKLKNGRTSLRELCRSPYIYGADILSTAIIKKSYKDQFKDLITYYTVAPFDLEFDVVDGTEQITMATLSFKERVVTVIQKSFFAGFVNIEEQLQAKLQEYLGPYVAKRNIKWEIILVDKEHEIITKIFERAHQWQPDFVAIWNIEYDMGKMLTALERAGIDPATVFSDPSVPREFQFFKYKKGSAQKVTASGKVTPVKPEMRWHTIYTPASFYFIDAMCAYRQIRMGQQEEQSYSLDSILDLKLGIRKLTFKEADGLNKIDWHKFMQRNHKFEYVIYNVFDCVSMEELDEETLDLAVSLPMFSKSSDFMYFKSQPRRSVDDLHWFCLIQDPPRVVGTTSDQMTDDFDEETVSLKDWIVTLPAHMVMDNGLQCIEENPHLRTNIRTFVGDLDVSSSYPNGEAVFNISRETTKREIIEIEGVSEHLKRMAGLNYSGGHTNAVEIATSIYKLPTFETLLEAFQKEP